MIFTLFTILLLIFSLNCFLVAFRVIKQEYLIYILNQNIQLIYSNYINQIILASIGLLLFVFVLYLIWLKQKMLQQEPSVRVATDEGDIKITISSLKQIILNILQNVEGVKEIKPDIQIQKNEGIRTSLQLIVSPDCNIPKTAQSIQEKLKTDLPRISGVKVKEIKINVTKIYYDVHEENSK